MASLLGPSGPKRFRKQMGHLRVPVFFGNAPLRGALACCALACRWWYAMIRWISAHWLLNSSLIDKFNDPSKHSWRARGPGRQGPRPWTAGLRYRYLAQARARQECFDRSLNLSINDEFNSQWEEIHRIINQMLEFKCFEKAIKASKAVYIYLASFRDALT